MLDTVREFIQQMMCKIYSLALPGSTVHLPAPVRTGPGGRCKERDKRVRALKR